MILSGTAYPQKLIFEGNSLMANGVNNTVQGQRYLSQSLYTSAKAIDPSIYYCDLSYGGETQTIINSLMATQLTPFLRSGDIVVLWEGTNDLNVNGLTGAQAWTNAQTFINTVVPYGVNLICCTIIARDFTTDVATLMDTRIPDYNTLMRNNTSLGYTLCDLAIDPLFDARADASNATYYNADKLHLVQAGQDYVASLIHTKIALFL